MIYTLLFRLSRLLLAVAIIAFFILTGMFAGLHDWFTTSLAALAAVTLLFARAKMRLRPTESTL